MEIMGKYTLSKEADKTIEKDMKVIIGDLRKTIPGVISIYLTGGFSRGEGAVRKINDRFYPYNDYDIQVISKTPLKKERIDSISTKISKKLGYGGIKEVFYPYKKENQRIVKSFYIDLKCDTPESLSNLMPRIRNCELKKYSMILWGKDLRYLIPDIKLIDIPLGEGAKLLVDRMSQLIEYYSTEKKHSEENLSYYIQQAYAACCTALLQLSGKYQIGYRKSTNIFKKHYKKDFKELYNKIPDLHKKIEQFINWKINPKKTIRFNVKKEWFVVRKYILEVSKYFFSKFLNCKINNLKGLSMKILNMEKEFYSPFLRNLIKNKVGINTRIISVFLSYFVQFPLKKRYYDRLFELEGIRYLRVMLGKSPDLVLGASVVYLIGSITEEGINEKILLKGKKLLNCVYPCKGKNWEEISLDYANAYIAFFMQKL